MLTGLKVLGVKVEVGGEELFLTLDEVDTLVEATAILRKSDDGKTKARRAVEDYLASYQLQYTDSDINQVVQVALNYHNSRQKIQAIKEVREYCGYGLKEAKQLIETAWEQL